MSAFTSREGSKSNPILVSFRGNIAEAKSLIADGVDIDMQILLTIWRVQLTAMEMFGGHKSWDDPQHPQHFMTQASDEQAEHAGRVIDRIYSYLEYLAEEQS